MWQLLTPKVQGALRHLLSTMGPMLLLYSSTETNKEFFNLILETNNWIAMVGVHMALLAFITSWTAAEKQEVTK